MARSPGLEDYSWRSDRHSIIGWLMDSKSSYTTLTDTTWKKVGATQRPPSACLGVGLDLRPKVAGPVGPANCWHGQD
jgi:hypothetical protein